MLQAPDNYYRFTFENATIRWGDKIDIHFGTTETYALTLGISTIYTICIFVVYPILFSVLKRILGMPFLKKIEKLHYTLLFLFSLASFLVVTQYLYEQGEFTSKEAFFCNPLPPPIRLMSLLFTVSKIWEWWDSFIHVQNGRGPWQMGFLHTYHHATTFFLFLLVNNFPATEKSGMFMNGFIHALMYYHFAFRLPRFMRPIMTVLQILQLASSTWMWGVTPEICSNDPELSTFGQNYPLEFYLPYTMAPVYLLFFLQFFAREYFFKSTIKTEGKKETKPKKE